MQSWKVNPETGDYVLSGGAPVETDSLIMPAYFRLKAQRGKWLYAPNENWGSDFHTITRRPSDSSTTKMENIALTALQTLVDDGRAKSVECNVVRNVRGGTELKTTILDASGEILAETFKGLGV